MEKTYFEFKITFLHIVVFLVAVIAIGIFLFYMGYQAGQRRTDPRTMIANEQGREDAAGNGELSVVDEPPVRSAPARPAPRQSIPAEIKLHEEQGSLKTPCRGAPAGPGEKPRRRNELYHSGGCLRRFRQCPEVQPQIYRPRLPGRHHHR